MFEGDLQPGTSCYACEGGVGRELWECNPSAHVRDVFFLLYFDQ